VVVESFSNLGPGRGPIRVISVVPLAARPQREIMSTSTDTINIIVFFNTDRLTGRRRLDRAARRELVGVGIKELRAKFPGAHFGPPNPTACSAEVVVGLDDARDLVAFLEDHGELASYMVNGPLVRPAPSIPEGGSPDNQAERTSR